MSNPTMLVVDEDPDHLELRRRDDPRTFFVPVVMLTSASEQSESVLALKGGLNSYVSKPLSYADFALRLEQVRS